MSALSPAGWLTILVLVTLFGLAVYGVRRFHHWTLQVVSAALAFLTAALAGIGFVNRYYDYYTTWSALTADLSADNGASALPVRIPVARGITSTSHGPAAVDQLPVAGAWTVHRLPMRGPVSGVNGRSGLVVLPPADPGRGPLPVLVLLHGEPGDPSTWTSGLQVAVALQREASLGLLSPMAVVLPDIHGSFADQQCLDAPGARLGTYLAVDVPADVEAALPVQPAAAGWAIGGLSEGGFCAADLAVHHPGLFRAAAVMDGYFRPDLRPAVIHRAYQGRRASASRDDLLALVREGRPLPRFWIMAGTRNALDYATAVQFATALGQHQDVRFVTVEGGRHTPPAWRAALPEMLCWASHSLAGRAEGGSIDLPLSTSS